MSSNKKDRTISYQELFDAYERIKQITKKASRKYTDAIAEYEAYEKGESKKVEVNKDWVRRRENKG